VTGIERSPLRTDSPASVIRGGQFRRSGLRTQSNFPLPAAVYINAMITSAIVFGMVGVAAGFTWDYVINRSK
jgi:hypothetical protein